MLRKISALLCVCAICVTAAAFCQPFAAVASEGASGQGQVALSVGRLTAGPGERVILPVTLEANPGIAYLRLTIEYDTSRLRIDGGAASVSRGAALNRLTYVGVNDETYQRNPFRVLWFGAADDISAGLLLNIAFSVADGAPSGEAAVTVTIESGDALNFSRAPLPVSVTQGGVAVLGADPPPPPQISAQPEPEQQPVTPDGPPSATVIWHHGPQEPPAAPQAQAQGGALIQGGPGSSEAIREDSPIESPGGDDGPAEAEADAIEFADVAPDRWYYVAVNFVAERGLFLGVGGSRFAPQATMTRAMFVTVLSRVDGIDPEDYIEPPFADVVAGQWYSYAITWAERAGIIDGGILYGNALGTFRPNDNITREEMAVLFANYLAVRDFGIAELDVPEFYDIEQASEWARDATQVMRSRGIIHGLPDGRGINYYRYNPQGEATRAEVAQIFTNLVRAIVAAE